MQPLVPRILCIFGVFMQAVDQRKPMNELRGKLVQPGEDPGNRAGCC